VKSVTKKLWASQDQDLSYLLNRIVNICDNILQNSIYHIGSINDQDQTSKKNLLLLHSAIMQNKQAEVEDLLRSKKIDLNKDGPDTLCFAARNGKVDVIEALAAAGADMNVAINDGDGKGLNALHIAALYGADEAAQFLLAKGLNIAMEVGDGDRKGYNVFHLTALYGETNTIKPLIKHLDSDKKTLTDLLEAKIILSDKDKKFINGEEGVASDDKYSALDIVARKGHIKALDLLLAYYAQNENLNIDLNIKVKTIVDGISIEKNLEQYLEENSEEKEFCKTILEREHRKQVPAPPMPSASPERPESPSLGQSKSRE